VGNNFKQEYGLRNGLSRREMRGEGKEGKHIIEQQEHPPTNQQ